MNGCGTRSLPSLQMHCCCWVTTSTATIRKRRRSRDTATIAVNPGRSSAAWWRKPPSFRSGTTTISAPTTVGAVLMSLSLPGSHASGTSSGRIGSTPPTVGDGSSRECWYNFSIGDVDFIMLDGRYYRTDAGRFGGEGVENPTMLGPVQKQWLKERLSAAQGTFKVLVSPVPWDFRTKPGRSGLDTWRGYAWERDEIFTFLAEEGIEGVVLLSADRHRSDAWKIERPEQLRPVRVQFLAADQPARSFHDGGSDLLLQRETILRPGRVRHHRRRPERDLQRRHHRWGNGPHAYGPSQPASQSVTPERDKPGSFNTESQRGHPATEWGERIQDSGVRSQESGRTAENLRTKQTLRRLEHEEVNRLDASSQGLGNRLTLSIL
jgi:hypothetical protein